MSATVTYKGETLTTATNQTRTLETAGTYLEDDITLVDVSTIPSGTKNITTNGTHDVTNYASANVAVPASAVDSGTKSVSITSNGTTTEDVTGYASASITTNVPNSYTSSDEGKVVSNGSLVSQTSATYTANDTYDTTTVNSVTVNVSGGGASIDDFVSGAVPTGATTLQSATSIMDYGLAYRGSMTSLFAPYVTTIGHNALFNCTGLTSISFPLLTSFSGDYALSGCTGLTNVSFPSLNNILRSRTFNNCSNLATADLGNCTQVTNQALINTTKLRTLVLRKSDAICSLAAWSSNALGGIYNNPTASTIYVPNALLSTYQTASNWSSAYNAGVTFAKIEGSIYE